MRLLVAFALAACGTASTPEPTHATSSDAAPAISSPAGEAEYRVQSHTLLGSSPPTEAVTLAVRSMRGDLSLTLNNLTYYCEPAPEFTVSQDGHTLTLTLIQPDNVTRCVGGHNMQLLLSGIDMRDPLIDEVVIVSADGAPVVSGYTVRAR